MRWISASFNPELAWILILFSLPVALSLAVSERMPFRVDIESDLDLRQARGAGGMSVRLTAERLVAPAMSRSPCRTWIVTGAWLSSAVENTCVALVGMVCSC